MTQIQFGHWLKDGAWSTGAFVLLLEAIDEIDPTGQRKKIFIIYLDSLITAISLLQIGGAKTCNVVEKTAFKLNLIELRQTFGVVSNKIRNGFTVTEALLSHLSLQFQKILSTLFDFIDLSNDVSADKEKFTLLCDVHKLLSTLHRIDSLDLWLKVNRKIDLGGQYRFELVAKVEASIEMYQKYEKMTSLEKLKQIFVDSVATFNQNLEKAISGLPTTLNSIWDFFCTGVLTVLWPVIAPTLALTDYLIPTREGKSRLAALNTRIEKTFRESPTTFLLLVTGLLGGFAFGALFFLPIFSAGSILPLIHLGVASGCVATGILRMD